MIDRATGTWSQFSYCCGTEIWLIYCSSANHCFNIVYCFIPCLTRRKWGLWKYWSLQSIQFYLYTKRVLATFFPFYNLSFRAVKVSGGRTRWRYLEGKTAKHRQQTTSVSHQWVWRQTMRLSIGWGLRTNLTFVLIVCHDFKHAKRTRQSCMSFQQGDFSRLSSLVAEILSLNYTSALGNINRME